MNKMRFKLSLLITMLTLLAIASAMTNTTRSHVTADQNLFTDNDIASGRADATSTKKGKKADKDSPVKPFDIDSRPDLEILSDTRKTALRQLIASSQDPVYVTVDFATQAINRLLGKFDTAAGSSSPSDAAREFLSQYAELFNLPRDVEGLKLIASELNKDVTRIRFQQEWKGIPVFAAGVSIDVTSEGKVVDVSSRIIPIENVKARQLVSAESAAAVARKALGIESEIKLVGALVVLDAGSLFSEQPKPQLSWQFSINGPEGVQHTFVDTQDGSVALNYNTTQTGENPTTEGPTSLIPQYHLNSVTGVPDFITFGQNGLWIPESTTGDPEKVALSFFKRYPLLLGTGDVPNQLKLVSVMADTAPPHMTHVILQQIYGGVPVFGAQLRVHLTPAQTITSISGNYLRDPQVVPVPQVAEARARDTAVNKIQSLRQQWGVPDDPRAQVKDKGLVVFPGKLTRKPGARNSLAYQFQFPEAEVFVAAVSDERLADVIYITPNLLGADHLIYDALGRGELSFPTLVLKNSQAVSSTPPTQEALDTDAFVTQMAGFYAELGRPVWDGRNGDAGAVTNSVFTLTPANPAHWDIVRNQAWFQPGAVTAETVGHEFTHGVTYSPGSAHFIPIDEPGALNEHYSDTMGAFMVRSSFPVGSAMRNPFVSRYTSYLSRGAGCLNPEDVFKPVCDAGNVHTNSGIGNRAAVLLSAGDIVEGGTHNGIGRNRAARLFCDTLTKRMHPWSTYIDERLNTWETARDFVARGLQVPDDTNPQNLINFIGVGNEVGWAFTQVDVDARLIPGWFVVPGGLTGNHSGRDTQTWYTGETLPPCYLVTDVELQVRVFDPLGLGLPWWEGRSRVMGAGGGSVTFPGGVFGATIINHGIGTRNKAVTVDYFHSGFLPLEIRPVIIFGPDPAPACNGNPPTLPAQSEFVTSGPTHWAFGVGGKGDDDINLGGLVREPGGAACLIDNVEVELLDGAGNIVGRTSLGSPPAVQHYGPFGGLSYGVEVKQASVGSSSATVKVHWWFDVGSAVRYRVHYYCKGNNCSL